jgi:hypothetical protein
MKPIKRAYKLLIKQIGKTLSENDTQYLKKIDAIMLAILKE